MARRQKKKRCKLKNTKEIELEKNEVDNAKWTVCPDCGTKLKSVNLSSHLNKFHVKKIQMKQKGIKRSSRFKKSETKKGSRYKQGMVLSKKREDIIIFPILFIIISSIIGGYFIYEIFNVSDENVNNNGQPSINGDDQTPVEPPTDDENWLESYTPEHCEGSEGDDWWINYAKTNSDKEGTAVNHPDWVKNALIDQSILIIAHSTDCVPCKIQTEDAEKILEKYDEDVTYFDVITSSDADQDKVQDIFGIYYDPEHPMSIPLTVTITKIKGVDGNINIGWHSYAGANGEDFLEGWIKDGIYYYEQYGNTYNEYNYKSGGTRSGKVNDTILPTIFDIELIPENPKVNDKLSLKCTVTDNTGVSSVRVYYCTPDFCTFTMIMENIEGNNYTHSCIPNSLPAGTVEYHIVAKDLVNNSSELNGTFFLDDIDNLENGSVENKTEPEINIQTIITASAIIVITAILFAYWRIKKISE